MAQIIVTIVVGKDNKGRDVTDCVPNNVALSIGDEDQVVWTSSAGDFVVRNSPGTQRPLRGEPWQNEDGSEVSKPGEIGLGARPEDVCQTIAFLTLPGGVTLPPGGSIMNHTR